MCAHSFSFFSHLIENKMAASMLLPVVLIELIDSDDEKPRGETRDCLKRRTEFSIYHTLILELMVEDPFKQMFRMSVMDFEIVLKYIATLKGCKVRCSYFLLR